MGEVGGYLKRAEFGYWSLGFGLCTLSFVLCAGAGAVWADWELPLNYRTEER